MKGRRALFIMLWLSSVSSFFSPPPSVRLARVLEAKENDAQEEQPQSLLQFLQAPALVPNSTTFCRLATLALPVQLMPPFFAIRAL